MVRTHSQLFMVGALLTLLSLGLIGGRAAIAQYSTPEAGGEAHPAHIHEGTCDNLNPEPLFPLTDVIAGTTAATPAADGETVGPASAVLVETSESTIDAALSDIVESDHAINIHESAENVENYIACGDIGGLMLGETLVIGLRGLNDSGYSGIAELEAMDDQTRVTIYLAQSLAGGTGPEGTPAAGGDADVNAVTVDIKDFTYTPDPIEIPVGGTVTWTNQDSAPHTATAQDRDVLQSGALGQGEHFSETFETAGTYAYFCEFHPNMKGTVVVE